MSDFKKYQCRECEHIYDEAKDDPDSGLAPGTRWADIPNDWSCPAPSAARLKISLDWWTKSRHSIRQMPSDGEADATCCCLISLSG